MRKKSAHGATANRLSASGGPSQHHRVGPMLAGMSGIPETDMALHLASSPPLNASPFRKTGPLHDAPARPPSAR